MTLEIAERNTDADHLILAGIEPNGSVMAAQIKEILPEWFSGDISIINITLDKKHPQQVALSDDISMDDAVVVMIDDVANSGRTLTYALKPFLEFQPRKIQTLVLVERTHKEFPVQPDYVGISIATTVNDFIDVELKEGELTGAYVE